MPCLVSENHENDSTQAQAKSSEPSKLYLDQVFSFAKRKVNILALVSCLSGTSFSLIAAQTQT